MPDLPTPENRPVDDLAHLGRGPADDPADDPADGPAAVSGPPLSEAVLDRARDGRRRQGAGAAAGALVVAAALVAITLPDGGSGPEAADSPTATPSPPAPSDYVQRSAAALIAEPGTRLRDLGVGQDGTVAVLWESPDADRQALAMDRDDGTTYVADPGSQRIFSLTQVTGGLLALRENFYRVGILRTSGALDPIVVRDEPVDPQPGDVTVDLGDGPRIFRPEDATVYELPPIPNDGTARAGYITPDGVLVVSFLADLGVADQVSGYAVLDRSAWNLTTQERSPHALPGMVAGNGDTVAVVRTVDEGGNPERVAGIRISHDGGETWREVPRRSLPPGSLAGLAVTEGGTTLFADERGSLSAVARKGTGLVDDEGVVGAVTRDGATVALRDAPRLAQLQTVGDRVWGVAMGSDRGPLWWSDDAGATWHEVPAPGSR